MALAMDTYELFTILCSFPVIEFLVRYFLAEDDCSYRVLPTTTLLLVFYAFYWSIVHLCDPYFLYRLDIWLSELTRTDDVLIVLIYLAAGVVALNLLTAAWLYRHHISRYLNTVL